MNVEKVNQYVIARGLHRLELGDNIWSATDAITGELGADFTAILRQLDCSLLALADAAMEARDARDATRSAIRAARAARAARNAARNAAHDTPPR